MANIGTSASTVNLTATGTTQSDAYLVRAQMNYFSTVASGTGALLNTEIGGGEAQTIYNGGANDLRVYPSASTQINGLGTNNPMLLPPATTCDFRRISSTLWTGVLSR